MTEKQFGKFIKAQLKEIEKYRILKTKEIGYDLGVGVIFEWIELYAEDFYKQYKKENKI